MFDPDRVLKDYLFGHPEDQAAIRRRLREDGKEPAKAMLKLVRDVAHSLGV